MINIRHKIKVKNAEIVFLNKRLFNKDLSQYEDKEAVLLLKPFRNVRSDNQNRYYWGIVMKILSNELGYFPDEVHEVMKQKFLNVRNIKVCNTEYSIPESTTVQNTTEFEDYLSKIRMWASSELEILIPLPNEVEY